MRDCSLSLPISSCLSHTANACCSVCLLPLFSMLINIWHFIEYIIIKKHTTQTISGLNRSTDTARKTPHAHIRWHILLPHSYTLLTDTHIHSTHSYIISLALLSVFRKSFSPCANFIFRVSRTYKRKAKHTGNVQEFNLV